MTTSNENILRSLREKRGYSLRRLADRANVHYVTIARLEKDGIRTANVDTLIRLSAALGVSLSVLLAA
jgi:transcriptional regulator with XRE-family HTH domain